MNTKTLPALYQIVTFGSAFGRQPSYHGQSSANPGAKASTPRAQRSPDFLVQLMVGGDPDLRKAIGSRHMAVRRENAYGRVLAVRPSQGSGDLNTLDFA